ncbi:phosphotransferase enzyme family protein [Paenibacillus tarimensis]
MERMIRELLSYYFDEKQYVVEPVPFGLTNLTKIIRINDHRFVARVYNPQTKDVAQLKFEIELISYLQQCGLSFEVPEFIPAKDGRNFVEISGKLGAVVHYIEGEMPDPTRIGHVEEMGRTAGQLSAALSLFKPQEGEAQGLVFHHLDSLHQLSGRQAVLKFIDSPSFALEPEGIKIVRELLEEIENCKGELDALPQQIVHHDLLIFNLLIGSNDQMNGVLDFDFASWDLRALELAVCLNHLLQFGDDSLEHVQSFVDQYFRYMTLNEDEIEKLPLLMRMYYVSLLTIYIGQHAEGKDIQSPFLFILDQLYRRTIWLERDSERLIRVVSAANARK